MKSLKKIKSLECALNRYYEAIAEMSTISLVLGREFPEMGSEEEKRNLNRALGETVTHAIGSYLALVEERYTNAKEELDLSVQKARVYAQALNQSRIEAVKIAVRTKIRPYLAPARELTSIELEQLRIDYIKPGPINLATIATENLQF